MVDKEEPIKYFSLTHHDFNHCDWMSPERLLCSSTMVCIAIIPYWKGMFEIISSRHFNLSNLKFAMQVMSNLGALLHSMSVQPYNWSRTCCGSCCSWERRVSIFQKTKSLPADDLYLIVYRENMVIVWGHDCNSCKICIHNVILLSEMESDNSHIFIQADARQAHLLRRKYVAHYKSPKGQCDATTIDGLTVHIAPGKRGTRNLHSNNCAIIPQIYVLWKSVQH